MNEIVGLNTFSPYSSQAGSTRVRVHEWLEYTRTSATSHDYLELLSNSPRNLGKRPLSVVAREIELRVLASKRLPRVLISRAATPLGNGFVEARLLQRSEYGIFDFDDAIMLPGYSVVANKIVDQKAKTIRMLTAADRVIAGNDWLANFASDYAKDVVMIPSCVNTDLYEVKSSYSIGKIPKMVWVGSHATERYLESISAALEEVHKQTRATLTVISSPQTSNLDRLPFVKRIPWSPQVQYALGAYDVALSPLSNGEWEEGKCGYKTLQYGASGLPILGSPVGVNSMLLEEFRAGSPRSHDEWVSSLLNILTASKDVRNHSGKTGRLAVERHFSFRSWRRTWLKVVMGIDSV